MTQSELVREFLRQKADALVRGDKAFFEHGLHPDFVYVNTRGGRLDKAGYIARVSTSGDLRFASQIVSDVMVTCVVGSITVAPEASFIDWRMNTAPTWCCSCLICTS